MNTNGFTPQYLIADTAHRRDNDADVYMPAKDKNKRRERRERKGYQHDQD